VSKKSEGAKKKQFGESTQERRTGKNAFLAKVMQGTSSYSYHGDEHLRDFCFC
jgi:hypothetical protein